MVRRLVLSLLVVSGLSLQGCGIEYQPGATVDVPSEWELDSLSEVSLSGIKVVPTLTFRDPSALHGNTGCNLYFGDYSLNGTALEPGQLATTKAGCPNKHGVAVERRLLRVYELTRSHAITTDGDLVLLNENEVVLARFKPL